MFFFVFFLVLSLDDSWAFMSNYVPAVNEDHQQREILQDCTKNK